MKKRKLIHGEFIVGKLGCAKYLLSDARLDLICEDFENCTMRLEAIRKELLRRIAREGFTPKDAPKTKMLAGELYEVLASRATRTDVDRNKASELFNWLHKTNQTLLFRTLFEAHEVLSVAPNVEAVFNQPGLPRNLRKHFERCLLKRSSRRLTVRKKKVARGSAPRRKAA